MENLLAESAAARGWKMNPPCLEEAGFEADSVAVALDAALIETGSQMGFAIEKHRGVHEDFVKMVSPWV